MEYDLESDLTLKEAIYHSNRSALAVDAKGWWILEDDGMGRQLLRPTLDLWRGLHGIS